MNKRTCFFLYLLLQSPVSFSQEHEHKHHHRPPEIIINVPQPEPSTPQDIKKLKIKLVAITAIITALLSAGVSIIVAYKSCN